MKRHSFVIFLVCCYVLTQTCIQFGKEFMDVGAAKLMQFRWGDWLCLIVPTAGSVGITVLAFFSKAFAQHMEQLEKGAGQPGKTTPP